MSVDVHVNLNATVDLDVDPFGRQADVPEQVAQFTRGVGEVAELLESKFIEGQYFSVHIHIGQFFCGIMFANVRENRHF